MHPESYAAARAVLSHLGVSAEALGSSAGRREAAEAVRRVQASAGSRAALSEAVGAAAGAVGEHTLSQVLDAIAAAHRDPREDLPGPLLLGSKLRQLADLQRGQKLQGVVRNATPFGCFVDVGLKEDGLVHISQMAARRVDDPLELVSIGQPVTVRVLSVDLQRNRLGLSMRPDAGGEGGAERAASAAGPSNGKAPAPRLPSESEPAGKRQRVE